MSEVVLLSNGPGELYTWAAPVVRELRAQAPDVRVSLGLVPCQFASGAEAEIARSFGVDAVATPRDILNTLATGRLPDGFGPNGRREGAGALVSLGGSLDMAVRFGERLGYPRYRYSFVPAWHRKLRRLFVHDERMLRRARYLGAPVERLELVGNLVADAVRQTPPAASPGSPHIVLIPGSRNLFALHMIPLLIAIVDRLSEALPDARFVWPVSRLLSEDTIAAGIANREGLIFSGLAGRREGDIVWTPRGGRLELIAESERYAHMRAADLAITIPGTNTLELGIANVPSVVLLPMNRPEVIPLEGAGHWLSLIPGIGTWLKRRAVRLFVETLSQPISLPNRFSGEALMIELTGTIHAEPVAERVLSLLADPADLARRRERLRQTMPSPGAAHKLVARVLADMV
ncbi:MAG: hypothetical protein U5L04_08975 [Trueperaceae bacterium]|nr:hypothetical protein [Trueperaceae bacterium]